MLRQSSDRTAEHRCARHCRWLTKHSVYVRWLTLTRRVPTPRTKPQPAVCTSTDDVAFQQDWSCCSRSNLMPPVLSEQPTDVLSSVERRAGASTAPFCPDSSEHLMSCLLRARCGTAGASFQQLCCFTRQPHDRAVRMKVVAGIETFHLMQHATRARLVVSAQCSRRSADKSCEVVK